MRALLAEAILLSALIWALHDNLYILIPAGGLVLLAMSIKIIRHYHVLPKRRKR